MLGLLSTLGGAMAYAAPSACLATQVVSTVTGEGCFITDQTYFNFTGATASNLLRTSGGTFNAGAQTLTGLQLGFTNSGWSRAANDNNSDITQSVLDFQSAIIGQPNGSLAAISLAATTTGAWSNGSNGPDSGTVLMQVCYGATSSVSGTFNITNCNTAGGTAIASILLTFTGTGNGSSGSGGTPTLATTNTGTLTGLSGITQWATRITVNLYQDSTPSDSAIAFSGITSSYDQIGIAPEPSTFGMLGVALAGLAAFRIRRKR